MANDLRLDEKEEFEQTCRYYACNDKTIPKRRFLNACKKRCIGIDGYEEWNEEEKKWRLKILNKYFKNFETELEEYKREKTSLGRIKTRQSAEEKKRKIDKRKKLMFEEKCERYSKNSDPNAQKEFFKSVKSCLLNTRKRWTEEEQEWRLNIIEKYFPGKKEELLKYQKNEISLRLIHKELKLEYERKKEKNQIFKSR